jgi:hypothetical protein
MLIPLSAFGLLDSQTDPTVAKSPLHSSCCRRVLSVMACFKQLMNAQEKASDAFSTNGSHELRQLALTSVLALTSFSFPQEGSIVGTIVDAGGNLVTGATAYARPVGRIHVGITPHASTNANGEFVIPKLGFGKYSLGAAKPEEDYPELYFAFYTGFAAKFPIVTLSAQHRSASIIVRLGKKAGILKGTVTDAATGRPLNANVEFRRVLEPKNFMSGNRLTNAQFQDSRSIRHAHNDGCLFGWLRELAIRGR